jgi:hypothetical protein
MMEEIETQQAELVLLIERLSDVLQTKLAAESLPCSDYFLALGFLRLGSEHAVHSGNS